MNIKTMRNIHLYLGVFFAPMLLFFIVTGCLQTFQLHERHKNDSYQPPKIIAELSQVHKNQRFSDGTTRPEPSKPFRYLAVLMSLGLLITTVLGIIMAFKYTKPWIVWVCLFLGVAIPSLLIWLAMGSR